MKTLVKLCAAALATIGVLAAAPAANAADIIVGGYAHGVGTKQSQEGGADFLIGLQTERIESLWWLLKPAVHVIAAGNTNEPTDFIAVGLDWPIAILNSPHWYIRPGIGFAGTTGQADIGSSTDPSVPLAVRQRRAYLASTRIDFGSKDLFEPELAVGYKINDRVKLEASYVHLSNGQILHSGKNQGLDDIGARLLYRFR